MVVITGGETIYDIEYCTSYLSGTTLETCEEWTTIYSTTQQQLPEFLAEGLIYGFAMISMFFIILRVLRKILNIF